MTTSSSFGSTTSRSLTGNAQGFQERPQEAFHLEGPPARRGVDGLYAGRKRRRRQPVFRQMHAHAAGSEPADFLHRAKQHELAFAQQSDAIAYAVDFREHVR